MRTSFARNTNHYFASSTFPLRRRPSPTQQVGRHHFIRPAERYSPIPSKMGQPIGFQFTEDDEVNARNLPVQQVRKIESQPTDNKEGRYPAETSVFRQHQPLGEAYEHIPLKDRYCLHKLEREWVKRQPLKGKRVLLNMHLTRFTLALINVLLKSGAHLEVTVSPPLVTHQNALQSLLAASVPVLSTVPDEKKNHYYDLVYDCGAGMRHIVPKTGMAELTHTAPDLYNGMSFPVITVDLSQTKVIETGLGTGDSFVRLIHSLAQQSIALLALHCNKGLGEELTHQRLYFTLLSNLIQIDALFSHNRFMIFGFGKVGKGIASALESAGTPKKNIFVVEVSPSAYMGAIKQGYCGLLLNSQAPKSIEQIKKILPEIWAVVTATGVEGVLSQHFSQSDFDQVALLANMSTGDDFGHRFTTHRILNHKKPANFMLDYPTEVMYLDATFALFLKAGEELLTNKKLKNGLNAITPALDQALLADWLTQHGDGIWRHRLGRLQTEQQIQDLRHRLSTQSPLDSSRGLEGQRLFHRSTESRQFSDSGPASKDDPARGENQRNLQGPAAKPASSFNSHFASLRY